VTFSDVLRPMWLAAGILTLAACSSTVTRPGLEAQAPAQPLPPLVESEPLAPPVLGETPEAEKVKVALLVPLTGNGSELGQAMLDAAQMALFELADERFELLPRDTRGTPSGAADAARDALADGARLVLGPLFSPDVTATRPTVQAAGVNMLAFSNDWTQAGNGTYIMGFVPGDQIRRVAGYAHAQGLNRFAALVPRNSLGDAVATALQDSARRDGFQIARIERFDPSAPDPTPAIRSLATATSGNMDAMVIAEGGQKARTVAQLLPAFEIDPNKVRLLGTGQWDDPTLGREPALVGGWYANADPAARKDFEDRFQAVYNRKPPRLATLAYDATALAAVLARTGGATAFDPETLTNPNGFAGVDGIFRLRPDGLVERGLAVIEITRDGSRVIDPAPSSFEAMAF
jgi:branched-chain amino acid transport system substrate-binding protein